MFHIVLLLGITVIAVESQAGLWSYLGATSAAWTPMMLGTLQPDSLRTLDAIHLASALSLEDSLADFICYDRRLSRAAADQGWTIQSPA